MIMSIPLCQSFAQDKLIWPFSPLGIYTVKSVSKFLANKSKLSSAPGDSSQSNRVWKIICELLVPNKVKNFMWRSCRDAIPVKKNLMWRKILSEDNCEQCKQPSKNFLHALWECSELSGLWNSNPTFLFRLTQSFSSL